MERECLVIEIKRGRLYVECNGETFDEPLQNARPLLDRIYKMVQKMVDGHIQLVVNKTTLNHCKDFDSMGMGYSFANYVKSEEEIRPVAITTIKREVIAGAAANSQVEFKAGKILYANKYIVPERNIDRIYFSCQVVETGEKFSYYLDNKNGKRYFKKDSKPSCVISFSEMAKLEPNVKVG